MKKRKPVPRKGKPFPSFPVSAGAPPLKSSTVKSIVSDDIMSLFGSAHTDRPYDPKEKAKAHGAPPGTFAIDPDDEMISLANSAPPNFTPPDEASSTMSRQQFLRLPMEERDKILVAQVDEKTIEYYRSLARDNAAGRDPLTLKAASIVMPLLKAKKVTPKMIKVMLEEILKARKEISKSTRPDFIEYLRQIPKGDDFDVRRRGFVALAGSCPDLPDVEPQPQSGKTVFDKIRAFRSRQKPLPSGEAKKLIGAGRHRLRRKRVLSPKFKKLMAKKTAGSTQADLDAVRGDR